MQESADAEPEEGPEGEDGDEEGKRSPKPPTWSGLRSIDKARATELPPPCLHGIATVSLAPLVQRTSTDRLTEIATVRPERVEHTAVYQQRKFPSAFLECGKQCMKDAAAGVKRRVELNLWRRHHADCPGRPVVSSS